MKIRCAKKFQSAGTLVEVITATCILAVMGGAILSGVNYGLHVMRLARENARATQVMLEKLETVRLYNWYQVTSNGFVPTTFTDYYDPQGQPGQQGAIYHGTITISNCPVGTSYADNMRTMTVTLRWNTDGRITHNRSVTTFVARDGLQNYVY